ncbi:hypothetical protein ACFYY5_29240 [Nocardia elegans]|uniref:Uncharacterized protein n=1 Tax=Nocardia elegans TaxID=300029 RepID=A0ABW6TLC4_9NOCA
MSIERDTRTVTDLLEIPSFAPTFVGYIDRDPKQFRDSVCEECDAPAAVYIEYTVDEPGEGYTPTDCSLCAEHAVPGVRVLLDREDRSHDHDFDVTVNYWAMVYGAFNTDVKAVAA